MSSYFLLVSKNIIKLNTFKCIKKVMSVKHSRKKIAIKKEILFFFLIKKFHKNAVSTIF